MDHDFILLDRSGSMGSLWREAISSINTYVHKLAEENVKTGVTLGVFDSGPDGKLDFQILRDRIIPSTWRDVSATEVSPRNGTPLNDAVAKIVNMANAGPALGGKYEKVAIIIMTDGEENSSREFTTAQARNLLDGCRAKNWQVIFLGANYDNVKQSRAFGGSFHQEVQTSAMNLGATMTGTASLRSTYGLTGAGMNYTETFKTAVKEDKAVDPTLLKNTTI